MLDFRPHIHQKDLLTSGAVAQLGERLNGIQEAKSSILFSSTTITQRVSVTYRNPFFLPEGAFSPSVSAMCPPLPTERLADRLAAPVIS